MRPPSAAGPPWSAPPADRREFRGHVVRAWCGRPIDYAVDGTLLTYNTNTVAGPHPAGRRPSRGADRFGYHGPDGQVVGDHDFGSVAVVGREPLVLDYQIADNAVYSDGKPITCDDMVLAWAANPGDSPASTPPAKAGYIDITGIDCQPGQKKAGCLRAGPVDRRLPTAVHGHLADAVA